MLQDIAIFLVTGLCSLGIALLVYRAVNPVLISLIDHVVRSPAATSFYSRFALVAFVVIGLAGISSANFDLDPGAAAIEYAWEFFDLLDDLLGYMLTVLGLLLVLATVLIASLGYRRDE